MNKSPAPGDPEVCARCAAAGPTCCQVAPGQEEYCFPVSELEKSRILDYGPERGGFSLTPNTQSFRDSLFRLFPDDKARLARLFPAGGEHYRLKTRENGDCAFLSPRGCTLPGELRPYYCRIFPLWMAGRGLTLFASQGCKLSSQAGNVRAALSLLGISAARARELFGRLRLAWGLLPLGAKDD